MSLFDLTLLFFFGLITVKAILDFNAFWKESDELYSINVRQEARRINAARTRVVKHSSLDVHPKHLPPPCRPARMPMTPAPVNKQRAAQYKLYKYVPNKKVASENTRKVA